MPPYSVEFQPNCMKSCARVCTKNEAMQSQKLGFPESSHAHCYKSQKKSAKQTRRHGKIFPMVHDSKARETTDLTPMRRNSTLRSRNSMLKYQPFSYSKNFFTAGKLVKFDPFVIVTEFEAAENKNDLWYPESKIERFKSDAIARALKRRNTTDQKATIDHDSTPLIKRGVGNEIRSVLIVDSNPAHRSLFAKYIQSIMGRHVEIAAAESVREATQKISAAQAAFPPSLGGPTHGFDVIICEEWLREGNVGGQVPRTPIESRGSFLFSRIGAEQDEIMAKVASLPCWVARRPRPRYSLLVGVSAGIAHDEKRLENGGADLIWSKPPPPIGERPNIELLRVIIRKRGGASAGILD